MSCNRVVCVSSSSPNFAPIDLLDVCRAFPEPHRLSGVGGKLLCLGEQYVLMLEGPKTRVDGLLDRIESSRLAGEFTVKQRSVAEQRAFSTVSITELYADEARRSNPHAAEDLTDVLIDLLAGGADQDEDADAFADAAELVERFTQSHGRVTELAA